MTATTLPAPTSAAVWAGLSPNAKSEIERRVRSGHITWTGPLALAFGRTLLCVLAQAAAAGVLWLRGVPAPWQAWPGCCGGKACGCRNCWASTAGGIGRVAAADAWLHPLSIASLLLGVLILVVAGAAPLGRPLPLIANARHAIMVVGVLGLAKLGISLAHRLIGL